ncbi:MAG: hypothetical protein E7365_00450 [Clostridiales bacterium]|nr:hypothetical protein [Clostridiales bacterium]
MNNNLLIVGASTYAVVAFEIATDMKCFDNIDFIDDNKTITPNGISVIGKTSDLDKFAFDYNNIVVAIGNPDIRLSILQKIKEINTYKIVSLISPKAYISPSAQIMDGCIIEPMSVIHSCCVIGTGCIISAGAVINHACTCSDGVHIDCNATVDGYCSIPERSKIECGEIFKNFM